MTPTLVSAKELATRYSLSTKTIRKLAANGVLPVVQITSRCIRFPVEECDAALKRRTKNAR